MKYLFVMFCLISVGVSAHEQTPTYVKFKTSYVQGVVSSEIKIFNKRKDAQYYEIQVLNSDMEPVPFATNEKIVRVPYLKKKVVEVFVPRKDIDRVTYICSKSRELRSSKSKTVISSRICSKAK